MATTFWLLAKSKNLPSPEEIARTIHHSDFPLEIDADWDWKGLTGWLPMSWNGAESGCEIDFEGLEPHDKISASKAGFLELDTLLVITTRGWDSLRAASVFAGTVAQASYGYVSESEGEYVGPDDALGWIANSIRAADAGEEAERCRRSDFPTRKADGSGARNVATALRDLSGNIVRLVLINDRLCLHLEGGSSIQGNMWRLILTDKVMDISRWRRKKQKEIEVLTGDGSDEERMKRADAMLKDIDKAKALDQKDMGDAYAFLKSVDGLGVEGARVVSPTSIEVELSGDSESLLEFSTDVYLAEFSVSTDSSTARMSAPLPVL